MNTFDKFSVLFWEDRFFTPKKAYELGQVSTDILNWDAAVLRDLRDRVAVFDDAAAQMLAAPSHETVYAAQEKLNAVFEIVKAFPPYCDLKMDWFSSYSLFPLLYEKEPDRWNAAMSNGTPEYQEFRDFLRRVSELPERLDVFRSQIMLVLEGFFENLPKRNPKAYAAAYAEYYESVAAGGVFFFPDIEFEQSFPANLKFIAVTFKDQPGVPVLAEETQFGELHAFLYSDFYRGLMHGNAPRRCHNCGRYFLTTRGYNTCYCNNIAPNETERTCRQVGAHRVAAKLWAGDTPLSQEYAATINRIKAQRRTGKISRADFTDSEDTAKTIVKQVELGELTDVDAIRQLSQISRLRNRKRK